jgi:hypothetical protein
MKIEVHHGWCVTPVVIETEEGRISLSVHDGEAVAYIVVSPEEARAIASVLRTVAKEAER